MTNRSFLNCKPDTVSFSGSFSGGSLNPLVSYINRVCRSQTAISKKAVPVIEELKNIVKTEKIQGMPVWFMHNENSGKGTVIIFHGLGQNAATNQAFYKKFIENGYSVIAPEFCGFGGHQGEISAKYIKEAAAIVNKEIIKKRNIDNAQIVTLCFGAQPGAEAIINNPEIKSLIMLAPFQSFFQFDRCITTRNWFNLSETEKKFVKRFPSVLKPIDKALGTDLSDKLKKIENPVYIIHGTRDSVVPFKYSEALAERFKDIKLIGLEGIGHKPENKIIEQTVEVLNRVNR
jgi:pimeloyl-ACP methyl ester carboxylesterase